MQPIFWNKIHDRNGFASVAIWRLLCVCFASVAIWRSCAFGFFNLPLQECQICELIVLLRIVQSLLLSCFEWSFSESPRIRISSLVKPLLAHEGLSTFWRSVV